MRMYDFITEGSSFQTSRQLVILNAASTLLFAAPTALCAQAAAKIATRQLPAASAVSTDTLGSIAAVRQLPNGNVLVNDQARRRLIMLDKDLKMVSLVADSTSSTNNAYGVRPGGLITYRGDSTLFLDPAGLSMLVIDQNGKIARTMAAPRPNDVQFMTSPAFGTPAFDAQNRLVYRTMDFSRMMPRPSAPGQPFTMPQQPDSAPLVRFDLVARKLDTAGYYKIPKTNVQVSQDANGRMNMSVTVNPLPVVDEWAVMSDGTLAFVRGQDYHVDFVGSDSKVTRSDKIPYDWQRLNDDDKQRFLDSAKVAMETARKAMASGDPNAVNGLARAAGMEGAGNMMGGAQVMIRMGGDGPAPPQRGGDGGRGGPGGPGGAGGPGGGPQLPPINMVSASELPDYKPVFGASSVKADMDARLWIRTIPTKVTTGGAVYDVIDRSGKLIDRVQVPANTTIAGFGSGGVVYLGTRDANGLHLQRIVLK